MYFYHEVHEGAVALIIKFFAILFRIIDPIMLKPTPKMNELKKVYVSSNCPEDVLSDLEHYAKIHGVELVKLKENNEELGIICKKPFPISVLSLE